MKNILVPTDFSDCAGHATKAAIKFAKINNGCCVHFLHYMSIPINWVHLEGGQDKLYPDISKKVNEVNMELSHLVKMAEEDGVSAKHYLGYNEGTSNVIDYIKSSNIDMVMIGSHGASGIREMFIGSNAQKIVRLSPVPTLVVKTEIEDLHKPNLIFISDFEDECKKPFEDLVEIAEVLDARIHLVFINTPAYFSETWDIEERMLDFEIIGRGLIDQKSIIDTHVFEEGLKQYCMGVERGIISMATHGRTGLSRVFYGSLTEKVINHLTQPVLSFHIPENITLNLEKVI